MTTNAQKHSVCRINIAQDIATIVGSRDIVDSLANTIQKADSPSVELDFTNVEFVSRSAAHEFLLLKEEFAQQSDITLSFTNTPENIAQMLRIVAANRALPKTKTTPLVFDTIDLSNLSTDN